MTSARVLLRSRVGMMLVLLLVFVPISLTRYIDGDEGYLLYAARLIADGKSLYKDFFYPQGPLVPSVFAILYKLFGPSWYGARALAGVFAAISGLLVFELGRRYTGSAGKAALAAYLYVACGYTLAWIPIVKTYGLAVLCLLLGVYVLERGGKYAALIGGLFIGLALEARLFVGIVGINAVVFTLRRRVSIHDRLRDVGLLAAGAILGLSLLLPPFLRDFESAFFGVVKFASIRFPEQTTLFGPIGQKIDVLLAELSIIGKDGAASAQLLGLLVLGVTAWFVPGLPRNRLTTTIWPTLLIVNLLPYNTFSQYVCIVVPFLALEAAVLLSHFAQAGLALRVLAPGLVIYAVMGALDVQRFNHTGADVIGVSGDPPAWRIGQVLQVAREMDSYNVPLAISWWPGYFVTSKTPVIPELANHFAFHVTGRLDAAQRRKLVLISEIELHEAILQKRYPLAVLGNCGVPPWYEWLSQAYRSDRVVGNTSLWLPQ